MAGGVNDFLPDVNEGDRLSAREETALRHNVNRLNTFGRGTGLHHQLWNGAGNFSTPEPPDELTIYNGGAEATIPAYGVILFNGVNSGNALIPSVKRPDTYGCQTNFFVNDASPIPANDFGTAQTPPGDVYIAAWDTTDGLTPAVGEMWGVQSGSYLIRKNYAGFRVLGVYDSTNHWAVVKSEPCYTIRGKPTPSQVPSGTSSTLAVYTGAYGSETQPAGNPTVANVRNDSSCTVQVKISTIRFNPDIGPNGNPWQWTDAYTQ